MKPEIKQRIEQLNNGKIPKGYQKTNFGVFPSDWETDKTLGDLFDFYGGLSKSRDELGEEGYAYLHYGDLHRGTFNSASIDQYEQLPKCDISLTGKEMCLMKDGDVAFLDASEDLEGTSRAVLIDNPENKPFIAGLHIIYGKAKNNNLAKWFKQYITSSESVKKQFQRLAVGFKVYGVNRDTISRIKVAFPSSQKEQSRIADILMKWDEAIELYDKQIDALTRYKKVCLKKMFPIKGQSVPEWRFQGFSGDWEQRKFSDLVLIERGGSPRPIDSFITDAPNGLNWVKIGDVPEQGRYITKTAEKIRPEGLSKTREVHPGDLILSNSMSFGKPYIMGIDGCIHDGWLLIRNTQKRFDLKFLCHMLGSEQMLNQYRSLAAGSTVNNLNKELVGNTTVTIPELEEQQVLGQYFESLDHLITLHQRKKEVITNQRKTLQQYLLNGIIRV